MKKSLHIIVIIFTLINCIGFFELYFRYPMAPYWDRFLCLSIACFCFVFFIIYLIKLLVPKITITTTKNMPYD